MIISGIINFKYLIMFNPLKLFKGKINTESAFNTISSGIDKLKFTKQEIAELNVKLADKVADFAEKTLSENTIRSKARRLISYVIIFAYILAVVVSYFSNNAMIGYVVKDSALKTAFIMVIAFFFGGYYMSKLGIDKTKK